MKKSVKLLAITLASAAIAVAFPAGAYANANSAQRYWRGATASGAIAADENCPVQVESELLTFDLNEFPSNHYTEEESLLSYGGKVTANYKFYNPADYRVDMTLAFPMGHMPDYAYGYTEFDDTARYLITANGEEVERTLRHTYSPDSNFDTATELSRIVDGFKEDSFYSPELPVTKYSYTLSGISYGGDYSVHAEARFKTSSGCKIMTDSNGYETLSDGFALSWFVRNLDTVEIFCIGEDEAAKPDWKFYYYSSRDKKTYVEGKATLKYTDILTFKELAFTHYAEGGTVSENDWYNAAVDCLNNYGRYNESYLSTGILNFPLMRWYEYSLTIQPKGRLENSVTAPIYPTIDGYYSPAVYGYTYLLSPAKGWAEFGSLEVVIDTPYYMTECSLNGFKKTDNGYVYLADGLPEGELTFTLCSSQSPTAPVMSCTGNGWGWIIFLAIFMIFNLLCAFIPLITLAVLEVKKRSSKRGKK